jgi:uncharacterized membrane protein
MDWEIWLHFAHIGGAMVWIGGGLVFFLIGLRVRRSGDLAVLTQFAGTLSVIGLFVFAPAVIVVLLTGIGLVLSVSGDFTRPWVLLGITGLVTAFLIGAVYLSRRALRFERLAKSGDSAGAQSALGAYLTGYAVVVVILIVTFWDMVFKPFS